MRKRVRLAMASALLAAFVLAIPVAASAASPFVGTWTSVDLDGSNQSLTISGSGDRVAVRWLDDAAGTACDGGPASVQGAGTIGGNVLTTVVTLTCMPGGNPITSRIGFAFTYDGTTDTLIDDSGVEWHRA